MSDIPTPLHTIFSRARLDDRQISELIGISHGLIADGKIDDAEVAYLQKWLAANAGITANPVIQNLPHRVNTMLSDKLFDAEESGELFETLRNFSGGDFELGEVLKSSRLPLDVPAPSIEFEGRRFCFTGTFAYGQRRDCEGKVESLGAEVGSLTKKTDFLVIGIYATESWAHSSFGRKIEKALDMKNKGVPIAIIGEEHWVGSIT